MKGVTMAEAAKADQKAATPEETPVVKKDVEGVRYIGGHSARSISAEEFATGAGVDDQKTDLVWDLEHGYVVPASDISKNALEYLRSQSDEFTLIESK